MTLANKITLVRFALALVCFAVLALWGRWPDHNLTILNVSAALFLIVSLSDVVDGYVARKYGEETEIGRIADPIVDKVLVCGILILTQRIPLVAGLVPAWIVVVVVVREFAVSGIRAAAEAKGIPFPANVWGKLKTFAQNVLVGASIMHPAWAAGQAWADWFTTISGWAAAATTIVSGIIYAGEARRIFSAPPVRPPASEKI